jgi:hypothetical protein
MALLVNPSDPEGQSEPTDAQDAARRLNLKLVVLNASTEREIDAAFATVAQQQIGAVVIGSDPFLFSRREQIVQPGDPSRDTCRLFEPRVCHPSASDRFCYKSLLKAL